MSNLELTLVRNQSLSNAIESIQILIYSLDCSALVVALKNEVLDNRGILQGTYSVSTTVNGKPSWINGDYAIWFEPSKSNWIFGDLSKIGQDLAYIYASNDFSGLTAIENQWNYWTGYAWKLAPNDISVTCNDDKGTQKYSSLRSSFRTEIQILFLLGLVSQVN